MSTRVHHDQSGHHDDFGGLHRDLESTHRRLDRRALFRIAARMGAGLGAVQLLGCAGAASAVAATANGTCGHMPEETAGPYPGDGSNGANVLNVSGVVRSDIRSSFGGLTGTAAGVPLTILLTVVSASTCAPLVGRRCTSGTAIRAGTTRCIPLA